MKTVTIERLGHLGDGIAAGPVFAARTLPGEIVEGEVDGERLQDAKILTPSADRIRPRCAHYKSCGGCSLHHASDGFVARWKVGVAKAALRAQGIDAEPAAIATSPPGSRRRAVFSARRTKSGAIVGFHAPRSESIAPIPDCILLQPDLVSALPMLEALVALGCSRKATARLAVTVSPAGLDIAVTGGKALDLKLETSLAGFAESHGIARLVWNGEQVAQLAAPAQKFGLAQVVPPPGAFLQATAEGEAALRSEVENATGGARRVVDLFAGCGTFSLPLAQRAQVHAVEGDGNMIAALDEGWRRTAGLMRVTTEARDLYRRPLEPDELDQFDAIVIDPPRAGALAQMQAIAASRVPVLASISCNPVSFARDARTLIEGGYRLERLIVVDQFRWSSHIELAATFVRRN